MTSIKKGDLIIIRDCEIDLQRSINDFDKCWSSTWAKSMAMATATATATVTVTATATVAVTVTNNKTKETITLKYYGYNWKPFVNNKLIAIVTENVSEEHQDLDIIKMIDTDGTVRVCRRAIIERFVVENNKTKEVKVD